MVEQKYKSRYQKENVFFKILYCKDSYKIRAYHNKKTGCISILSRFIAFEKGAKKKSHGKRKQILHGLKINGCAICGYDKCDRVLDFHHVNPEMKMFQLNVTNMGKSNIIEELNKCVLLCKNCHSEIHEKEVLA